MNKSPKMFAVSAAAFGSKLKEAIIIKESCLI